MQRPLQTHHLLLSSTKPVLELMLPPTLLQKRDSSHKTSWKVWVSKVVLPSFIPNISQANNTFMWNGVRHYLWPGRSSAQDLCYQISSTGLTARWSHVDNKFVFQAAGLLDLTAPDSCADVLGFPRAQVAVTPGTSSPQVPQLGLLDYVVVGSSLASNTHVYNDGMGLAPNTHVLCTLPVTEAAILPYEDLAGDRAVYYQSSIIDAIRISMLDASLQAIPALQKPWHCTVTIAEVTDVFEDQLGQLNRSTAELLDLKKLNTVLKNVGSSQAADAGS